jgi:hypothetical protein
MIRNESFIISIHSWLFVKIVSAMHEVSTIKAGKARCIFIMEVFNFSYSFQT